MNKLPLDDPRWLELRARGSMPYVLKKLRDLVESHPGDYEAFADLWPYFCSESTTWESSFAAAPYFIECAQLVPEVFRWEYGFVIGSMETYIIDDSEIPDYLQEAWNQSKIEAMDILIGYLLRDNISETTTRYILSAISALKGHRKIAEVLECLDCCEECGARLSG